MAKGKSNEELAGFVLMRFCTDLGDRSVDLQNLLMALDLSYADLAGQLSGGRAISLQ